MAFSELKLWKSLETFSNFCFMLVCDEVASATFSLSNTVGSTLNFTNETNYNPSICVVFVIIMSIMCRFCVD